MRAVIKLCLTPGDRTPSRVHKKAFLKNSPLMQMPEMPVLSLIVAAAENDVIGRDNELPWHLPDDLKRFKALTMGKPMLMGRATFESIGKPLPGRTSLVLTRSKSWRHEGVIAVSSIEEALERAGNAAELAVIGGTEVFRAAMPLADRIYLTRVHAEVDGDATMPRIDPAQWREVERVHHPADDRHEFPMTFITLERVSGSRAGAR